MVDFSKINQYNGDMRKLKGFTLIEVILVLAVAGLIMAMVFVGVPALTATQRDSSRKDQMLQFISNLKSYQANNNRGSRHRPRNNVHYILCRCRAEAR